MNWFDYMPSRNFGALSGKEICNMMRRTHVTIRRLSQVSGITMKRIRQRRGQGTPKGIESWEIFYWLREAQLNQ